MFQLRKNGHAVEVGDVEVAYSFRTNADKTWWDSATNSRWGQDREGNLYELRELPDVTEYESSRDVHTRVDSLRRFKEQPQLPPELP